MKVLWLGLLLCSCGSQANDGPEGRERMTSSNTSRAQTSDAEQAYRAQASEAELAYRDCVLKQAAQIGTRETISHEQADQLVIKCEPLLRAAASEFVARNKGFPMTNLPAGMETEESRMSVARTQIEHAAKMAISKVMRQVLTRAEV